MLYLARRNIMAEDNFMANLSSRLTRKEKALVEIFLQALCYVHEFHSSLFEDNVNERDVCSHLMSFIERSKENTWFNNYFVDVEYNRMLGGGQKIIYDEKTRRDIVVIPDLVIHGRDRIDGHENLLCVEIKKSNAPSSEKEDDFERLSFLTKRKINLPQKTNYVYGYLIGIYYEYNYHSQRSKLKIFKNGKAVYIMIFNFCDIFELIEKIHA